MASNDFTAADGTALSTYDANWSDLTSTYVVANAEINSNILEATGAWTNAGGLYSASSSDFCQVVWVGGAADGARRRVGVRSAYNAQGYEFYAGSDATNYTAFHIGKGGAWEATKTPTSTFALADDLTVAIEATGTSPVTVEIFANGVSQGTWVDSTTPIASGSPSLAIAESSSVLNTRLDNWTDTEGGGGGFNPACGYNSTIMVNS